MESRGISEPVNIRTDLAKDSLSSESTYAWQIGEIHSEDSI